MDTLVPHREPSGYDRAAVRAQAGAILTAIVVYWLAFLALNVYELQNDYRMLMRLRKVKWTKPVKKGPSGIDKERKFMWCVWAVHVVFCVLFAVSACVFSASRQFRMMRTGVKTAASGLRWMVWMCIIGAITTDWLKLYALGSVLNKLMYVNQWCPGNNVKSELDYALKSKGGLRAVSPTPSSPGCSPHRATPLIRASIIAALANLLVNTFIYFARGPKGFFTKILSIIPAVVLTALLYLKPLSSMMLLHYSQRKYIMKGDFTVQSETVIALISQVLALLFSLQMAYVISDLDLFSVTATRLFMACGCKGQADAHDAAVKKATAAAEGKTLVQEAPMATPQAQVVVKDSQGEVVAPPAPRPVSLKLVYKLVVAQWFYTGQLPCVFGFLAPILATTVQSLWNFWVGLDLVLGAAMFVAYVFLFFSHKLLFPQWQRTA